MNAVMMGLSDPGIHPAARCAHMKQQEQLPVVERRNKLMRVKVGNAGTDTPG